MTTFPFHTMALDNGMEEILIDTDVVLNVLLREEPFFTTFVKVFA